MRRHYVEFGVGSPTIISTAIEYPDRSETRFAGARWPERISGSCLRLWTGYVVIVVGWRGIHIAAKCRPAFKLLLGIAGASQ